MDLDIDPGKLLYAVGAVFGVAAVLYFARDIVFDLSITVRAVLLLMVFIGLLAAALSTSRSGITPVLYVLSAAAYLAFLWYTLSRFEIDADGTFVALLLSAGLFLGLGYLLRERAFVPPPGMARRVALGVAVVGLLFVGADLAMSDVDYELSIRDQAQIGDRGEVTIGTVTATNQFVFREPLDMPRPLVCSYGFDRESRPVDLRVTDGGLPDTVSGGGAVTATIVTWFAQEELDGVQGPIPIETADRCPETAEGPKLVVVPGGDVPRPPR